MIENIPADLLDRFNKHHKEAKILDFRIKEFEAVKTETIFYEYFNVLGVLRKTTILYNDVTYTEDNSLIPGDIDVFLEKSRWFK